MQQIACNVGVDLQDDVHFRAGVREGIAQADCGEFVEEEEMDARRRRGLTARLKEHYSHYRQPAMCNLY